jgi:hypothetical protein
VLPDLTVQVVVWVNSAYTIYAIENASRLQRWQRGEWERCIDWVTHSRGQVPDDFCMAKMMA